MMKTIACVSLSIAWLISSLASAHHGPPTDSSIFTTERMVEMDAEIVEVFWRNPHVRIKMRALNAYGAEEEWQMELRRGPNAFRRIGLTRDFLKPGEVVRVAGYISKRKPNLLGVMNMLLPNGRELAEVNVEARFTDNSNRLLTGEGAPGRQFDPALVAAAERAADGIFRAWVTAGLGIPEVPIAEYIDYLSNTAHQLRARFIPSEDDPELKCQSGMPSTMFDPAPMEIKRDGENIMIHLAEYDIKRTIHMDGADVAPTPSRLGYSVGHWENNSTLVVTTSHIDWPFFDPWGTPQSDQISYVERFTLSEDGSHLGYSLTADDPVMFIDPVVLERAWRWQPGLQIGLYDCTLWDGDTEYDPETSNPFTAQQR